MTEENQAQQALKVFKIEAQGDTVYVQAVDEDKARAELAEKMGPIPLELLTMTEVPELPEGEELLNP